MKSIDDELRAQAVRLAELDACHTRAKDAHTRAKKAITRVVKKLVKEHPDSLEAIGMVLEGARAEIGRKLLKVPGR